MQKEFLQKENIFRDLVSVLRARTLLATSYYLQYIIPFLLLALLIGFLTRTIWIGLLIFSPAIYPIVRFVQIVCKSEKQKKEIKRLTEQGKLNVSVEIFERMWDDTVYEPHTRYRRYSHLKEVRDVRFSSGLCWQVPDMGIFYQWSKDFHLSRSGLENTSVQGDEFYFIALPNDNDISYIYPCKYFILEGAENAT